MFNRRKFLLSSLFSSLGLVAGNRLAARGPSSRQNNTDPRKTPRYGGSPVVVSTWSLGLEANRAAWQILNANGRALDAVEAGVNQTEASLNCCVGLGANPDREGIVTVNVSSTDWIFETAVATVTTGGGDLAVAALVGGLFCTAWYAKAEAESEKDIPFD